VKIDDGIDYVSFSRHNKGPKGDILKKKEKKKRKKNTTKRATGLQTLGFSIKDRISKWLS